MKPFLALLGALLILQASTLRAQTFRAPIVMQFPHEHDPATLMPDGTVLVAGDFSELYLPKSNTFILLHDLIEPRFDSTATLLRSHRVLICGGNDTRGALLKSCEVYVPDTSGFISALRNTSRLLAP